MTVTPSTLAFFTRSWYALFPRLIAPKSAERKTALGIPRTLFGHMGNLATLMGSGLIKSPGSSTGVVLPLFFAIFRSSSNVFRLGAVLFSVAIDQALLLVVGEALIDDFSTNQSRFFGQRCLLFASKI
jgi:hypothetical protein